MAQLLQEEPAIISIGIMSCVGYFQSEDLKCVVILFLFP